MKLKQLAAIAVLLIAAVYQYLSTGGDNAQQGTQSQTTSAQIGALPDQNQVISRIRAAKDNSSAKFWTVVQGEVIKNLPDDTKGSQHQKFLVRVANDITLLVAHNIDLAPRVPVREGDRVTMRGEYAWNNRGGVIHWTHHDPRGKKEGGWIEVGGKRYE